MVELREIPYSRECRLSALLRSFNSPISATGERPQVADCWLPLRLSVDRTPMNSLWFQSFDDLTSSRIHDLSLFLGRFVGRPARYWLDSGNRYPGQCLCPAHRL